MKKILMALMAVAAIALTGCKESKDEPQIETPKAVDLGLSVKWAPCNIGATKPEEYGDHFAWGETTPKEMYIWETYKFCSNDSLSIYKYTCPDDQKTGIWYDGDTFIGDNKTILDLEDDAAHIKWGGSWRMPTQTEQYELLHNCNWTWTENYNNTGIKGYIVSSKTNNNSIFLPAAGAYDRSSELSDVGVFGYYWSSSLYPNYSVAGCDMPFNSGRIGWGGCFRYCGLSIRPVCK